MTRAPVNSMLEDLSQSQDLLGHVTRNIHDLISTDDNQKPLIAIDFRSLPGRFIQSNYAKMEALSYIIGTDFGGPDNAVTLLGCYHPNGQLTILDELTPIRRSHWAPEKLKPPKPIKRAKTKAARKQRLKQK